MLLNISKVKEDYNISRITLLRWEKEGIITPCRTPKGRRRYKKEELEEIMGLKEQIKSKKVILYGRVSTIKQEEYLKNQIKRLETYAQSMGYEYIVISEIASGVNEHRRGLRTLLTKIKTGEAEKVIIEYPDRLARFGYEYLKNFINAFGVELIVMKEEEEETEDLNKELAEDLIAIVTSFAGRLYGKRCGRRSVKSKE